MNMINKVKSLFADKKLKTAFKAIKTDMELIQENHESLKGSTNEWVIFLDQENRTLKTRVRELEKKLDAVQDEKEEAELAVMRQL
jgi:vacuolar-type H+-ATPase subunit I/STV1